MCRERPIGDEFRYTEFHPGLPETIAWLRVEEGTPGDCKDCHFKGRCMSQSRIKETCGLCSQTMREDRTSVIFKLVRYK